MLKITAFGCKVSVVAASTTTEILFEDVWEWKGTVCPHNNTNTNKLTLDTKLFVWKGATFRWSLLLCMIWESLVDTVLFLPFLDNSDDSDVANYWDCVCCRSFSPFSNLCILLDSIRCKKKWHSLEFIALRVDDHWSSISLSFIIYLWYAKSFFPPPSFQP